MTKRLACLAAIGALVPLAWIGPVSAADQGIPHARVHHFAERDCGICGCWEPDYVRHREVIYQYPSDARYTLTSEPFYVPGPVHTYVHNWF
jgi:hypothetical protein